MDKLKWVSTTILAVQRNNKAVMIGDGQVSYGSTVFKSDAKKVRKLNEDVICGFAGSVADALTLVERLETQIEKHPSQTLRACVNVAKAWRTDKYLRHLNASLVVMDKENIIELDGTGNVIEIKGGIIGIGSGGLFAVSAAKALMDHTQMDAEEISQKAMKIAADLCIYTNHNWAIEKLEW
jgi:ATP-dependent HslUV protease, peptidase subunit HslV